MALEQVLFVSKGSDGLESSVESPMERVDFSESHAQCLIFPGMSDTDFGLPVSTKSFKNSHEP